MSTDGRLDLDDLGGVIEHASSLDEVRSGAGDERPTLGERFVATGVPGWFRRHRAAIAGVTAVVVALGAFLWVRRDTRPPDDGLAHVAVLDANSQAGIETTSPGMLSTTYTVVRQRPGDTVELLGITGPGIRATGVGRPVTVAGDSTRSSWPVLATLGCQDPAALDAPEDRYRLLVRRTDAFGRTVETQEPLPIGSLVRWGVTVGGACLQTLASTGVTVDSVGATPSLAPVQVNLTVGLHSTLDRDVAIDILGYGGNQSTAPEPASVIVPAGGRAVLHVAETIADCVAPHLDGVIMSPDGQSGFGVTDRTLDAYARVVTDSPDASATGISLPWSQAESLKVTAAFRAACAGLPSQTSRVVSTALAPSAEQALAQLTSGDPSTLLLRAVVDVRTPASAVTVADGITADQRGGGPPTIVTLDPATGRRTGTDTVPAVVPTVDGVARVTVEWTLACSGSYSPPSARLQLVRDGRRWPVWLSLDEPVLAGAVLRACPDLSRQQLIDNGWASLQPIPG